MHDDVDEQRAIVLTADWLPDEVRMAASRTVSR